MYHLLISITHHNGALIQQTLTQSALVSSDKTAQGAFSSLLLTSYCQECRTLQQTLGNLDHFCDRSSLHPGRVTNRIIAVITVVIYSSKYWNFSIIR